MSEDAKYLDECLRLRGGVSPDPDDDRAVRNVLNELAAARAEVEAMKQALATVGIEQIDGEWCYTSENGEQSADDLADALQRTIALIDRDTVAERDALKADLAAVRKVEEWEGQKGTRINWIEAPREQQSEWRAWSWGLRATANPRIVASGGSIVALGRALAAQEGNDGTK